jgi:hypothetical protein
MYGKSEQCSPFDLQGLPPTELHWPPVAELLEQDLMQLHCRPPAFLQALSPHAKPQLF